MPRGSSSKQKFELSKKIRVGVICGGTSSERLISLKSGKGIAAALLKAGCSVTVLDPKKRKLFLAQIKSIHVAFIALHGLGGEDGAMQAFLKKRKIPFVGTDVRGCRRSFRKEVAKRAFQKASIPTPNFIVLKTTKGVERLFHKLSGDLFVKPSEEGSSIGVFELSRQKKNLKRIEKSLQKYGKLLVEEKIVGREFTVGVLGQRALPVVELVTNRSFYDFKAKYTKGNTKYKVPAKINASLEQKLKSLALKTHKVLELRDMSRVDFMVSKDGKPYVLEANTIPGFTELSLLPKAARAAGISYEALCLKLVNYALQRR